jgi:hypothetical protein
VDRVGRGEGMGVGVGGMDQGINGPVSVCVVRDI